MEIMLYGESLGFWVNALLCQGASCIKCLLVRCSHNTCCGQLDIEVHKSLCMHLEYFLLKIGKKYLCFIFTFKHVFGLFVVACCSSKSCRGYCRFCGLFSVCRVHVHYYYSYFSLVASDNTLRKLR